MQVIFVVIKAAVLEADKFKVKTDTRYGFLLYLLVLVSAFGIISNKSLGPKDQCVSAFFI